MAARRAPTERATRRHWPAAEKRRIVELTLIAGASLDTIAGEHGVHPNSVYQWRRLYRAGRLDGQVKPLSGVGVPVASATFVPMRVIPEVRKPQPAMRQDTANCIVQIALASGATLRIETGAMDAALVCALVAELRR